MKLKYIEQIKMKAKFKVTLLIDVGYESDVRTFLNELDDMRYAIESIESLELKDTDLGASE